MNYFWVLEETTLSGAPIYLANKNASILDSCYRKLEHVCTTISINHAFEFDTEDDAEDFLSDIITITNVEEKFFLMNLKAKEHQRGD